MPKKINDNVNDIYSEDYAEELEENDSIDEAEEGFMRGYNEEESVAECSNCRKVLGSKFIEEKINNKMHRFCSERCANKFSRED